MPPFFETIKIETLHADHNRGSKPVTQRRCKPLKHIRSNPGSTDLCLVFPPVWVPLVPHLALPTLTAHLRQKGFGVVPLDENVRFFTQYLFTSSTLERFIDEARRRAVNSKRGQPSGHEIARWEEAAQNISRTLSVLREKERFLHPERVVQALDDIQALFRLCSLVHGPGDMSFNHYRREDVSTVQDLEALCEDSAGNVFLPYFRDCVIPRIQQESPLAVGISISSIHQLVAAMTLARLLRLHLPHVHVVAGGKHLLNIEDNLLSHARLFRRFFHSAVLQEGEIPLERLLSSLRSGESPEGVPSMRYLQGHEVVATERAEPLPLEALPNPDFTDVPWDEYLIPSRYAPIRMAEGCYWGKCTFCFRYGPPRAAFRPPKQVLDEMEQLVDVHGVHDFTVNDDCLPPEYWERIAEGILHRRLDLSMLIWAKPVAGFTKERLNKMARAGIRQVRWGLESGQPRILKLMRKGTTIEGALRVLQDADREGIWNHACMIAGFPTETKEEAGGSVEFVREHSDIIHSFIFYPFALFRNTYIFHHPEEFHIRDIKMEEGPMAERYTSYTQEKGMTPEEAREFVPRARRSLLEKTYQRPFWSRLKIREYLQLYLDYYGLERVRAMDTSPAYPGTKVSEGVQWSGKGVYSKSAIRTFE